MRDAFTNQTDRSMQERMRKLCDQIITFEVSESFPVNVVEIVPAPKPEMLTKT